MVSIDTDKLSKEINDTLMHRACVMRSGRYLAKYLIRCGRSVDALRLIANCAIHDISKINNLDEFLSLASIVDEMDSMRDVGHVLTPTQIQSIKKHWANNKHHEGYWDDPNDMGELYIMEKACDCHARSKQFGTNLLDYIDTQQEIKKAYDEQHGTKTAFDARHYYMLRRYCMVLVELTKDDDYSVVLNDDYDITFNFKDTTMRKLENFDISQFPESIKTERLYFRKEDTADFASVAYSLNTKEDNEEIGNIVVMFNGVIEYKIFVSHKGNDYAEEAIAKLIDVKEMNPIFVKVRKEDTSTIEMFERLGFTSVEFTGDLITLRYSKEVKKLVKAPK